jgi:hypothetical protein
MRQSAGRDQIGALVRLSRVLVVALIIPGGSIRSVNACTRVERTPPIYRRNARRAPYAYQNGAYNLIEPVRLNGDASNALAQASESAVKGQWLRQHSKNSGQLKQLVVVGDFSSTDNSFRSAVSQMMKEHSVRLYDLAEVGPLVEDIRKNAQIHRTN